jgi:hypothetical protein
MAQPTDLTLIESDQEFRDFRDQLEKAYNDTAVVRSDVRAVRDDVEQTASNIGALGGIDGTAEQKINSSTLEMADGTTVEASNHSGEIWYVVGETVYYKSNGTDWNQTGPDLSDASRLTKGVLPAAQVPRSVGIPLQVGYGVSVPDGASPKKFDPSDYSSDESMVQALSDHAANNGGGRVLLSEDLLPYDASSVSFDASVRMVRAVQKTDVFDVRAYGAKGKNVDVTDPATMQDDTPAIQAAIDAATATDQVGETVYLPPGNYTLDDDHLRMRGNNFELRGAGFYWTAIRRINISNPSAAVTNNVVLLFPHRSQDDVRQTQVRKISLGPQTNAGNTSPTIQMGGSSEVTDDGAANVNITETEFFKVRFTHSNVCFKNFGDGTVAGTRIESCGIEGMNNAVYQLRGGDTRKWTGKDNLYNDTKGPILQLIPNELTAPRGGVNRIALRPIAIKKHAGPLVDLRNSTASSNAWGISIQGGRLRITGDLTALLNSPENGEHITDFSLTGMNVFRVDGGTSQYDWISRWKDTNLSKITIAANHFSGAAFADTYKNLTPANYTMGLNNVDKGAALTAKDASTVDTTYGAEEEGVIKNNRTRIEEIEARLQEQGIIF